MDQFLPMARLENLMKKRKQLMNDTTDTPEVFIPSKRRNKLTQWTMLAFSCSLLVAMVYLPTIYMLQKHEEVITSALIKLNDKGVDPIAARCALADQSDQLCILFIASKKTTP